MVAASMNDVRGGTRVEWDEVQRVLLRGYPKLPWAHFLLLRVVRPAEARRFLSGLLGSGLLKFGWGERHDTETTCNVAFTRDGLEALGLDAETISGFSPEFVEGMVAGSRPRKLGDSEASDPSGWLWGNAQNSVHAVLMVYAPTRAARDAAVDRERARFSESGLEEARGPSGEALGATHPLPDRREHFGFTDGISQPRFTDEPHAIRSRAAKESDRLATGELLLGYPNEVGLLPRSPVLSSAAKARAIVAGLDGDFGRNGSYLVFRTLDQDVDRFWRATKTALGRDDRDARVELAAKMVGRWPDGTPLVSVPKGAAPHADREDFDFAHDDPWGQSCPLGAHIRRANPRATLARDPEMAVKKSKKHRILRRGRSYGDPFVAHLSPEELIKACDDAGGRPGPRGLHFMCYVADIANQFEFVQQTWLNGPVFQGLHGEVDPLAGNPAPTAGLFTIPGHPIRSCVHALPRFVNVRGGAYFFLPSRSALGYLASLRD